MESKDTERVQGQHDHQQAGQHARSEPAPDAARSARRRDATREVPWTLRRICAERRRGARAWRQAPSAPPGSRAASSRQFLLPGARYAAKVAAGHNGRDGARARGQRGASGSAGKRAAGTRCSKAAQARGSCQLGGKRAAFLAALSRCFGSEMRNANRPHKRPYRWLRYITQKPTRPRQAGVRVHITDQNHKKKKCLFQDWIVGGGARAQW